MKTKHLVIGVGLAVTAVLVVQIFSTRHKKRKKRVHIANEGYETAEDILYPRRTALRVGRSVL
jgi:predicted small secreted protein